MYDIVRDYIIRVLLFYLMLDFDVFVEYATEFVVISIPLKRLVSAFFKESFPIVCRAELFRSAR